MWPGVGQESQSAFHTSRSPDTRPDAAFCRQEFSVGQAHFKLHGSSGGGNISERISFHCCTMSRSIASSEPRRRKRALGAKRRQRKRTKKKTCEPLPLVFSSAPGHILPRTQPHTSARQPPLVFIFPHVNYAPPLPPEPKRASDEAVDPDVDRWLETLFRDPTDVVEEP
jgi:hypothetical protein